MPTKKTTRVLMQSSVEREDAWTAPQGVNLEASTQLLAQAFSTMSFQERQNALCDVHAVPPPTPEPSLEEQTRIFQYLLENMTILVPKESERKAYGLAWERHPDYVQNPKFLIKFLRADDWNVEAAACRLAKFFQWKLELFDSSKLGQEITQADLDEETLQVLYGGFVVNLPLRDRAGRHVTIFHPLPQYSSRAKLRRIFYGTMIASNDESAQRHGRVVIVWLPKIHLQSPFQDPSPVWSLSKQFAGMPSKMRAMHMCILTKKPGKFQEKLVSFWTQAEQDRFLVRTKIHIGTPDEVKEQLQGYGIPVMTMPLAPDGTWDIRQVNQLLIKQKLLEEEASIHQQEEKKSREFPFYCDTKQDAMIEVDSIAPIRKISNLHLGPVATSTNATPSDSFQDLITVSTQKCIPNNHQNTDTSWSRSTTLKSSSNGSTPVVTITKKVFRNRLKKKDFSSMPVMNRPISEQDVLLGRGQVNYDHVGNVKFRKLIDKNRARYDLLEKKAKTQMAMEIVALVKASSGRFLKLSDHDSPSSVWVEVDDQMARRKVATCFRTLRHNHPRNPQEHQKETLDEN